MPPPPKTLLSSPRKAKVGIVSKVKRVVNGRITKLSKKVEAQLKDGKIAKATVVTSRAKVKDSKRKAKTVVRKAAKSKVTKMSTPKKPAKQGSSLGKRKRSDTSATTQSKSLKTQTPTRGPERKVAKPRSKVVKTTVIESPTKPPARSVAKSGPIRPVHDTVSNRSRKNKSH